MKRSCTNFLLQHADHAIPGVGGGIVNTPETIGWFFDLVAELKRPGQLLQDVDAKPFVEFGSVGMSGFLREWRIDFRRHAESVVSETLKEVKRSALI